MKKIIKKIILVNKKEGETPLEALSLFRSKHQAYKDLSITYAGRLDPMASGLLLLVVGDEIKNKSKYLDLDKQYEFEVLFGFATDTYDILGKVLRCSDEVIQKNELEKQIQRNLKFFKGKFIQKYPIYSSKTVKGKPLFEYGRRGESVDSPEREVNVKSLTFLNIKKVASKKLLENIEKRIKKVGGDFRQEEILKIWRKDLKKDGKEFPWFLIASFKIKCGSGTYVRGIANSLGKSMNIPALAYSIKRTKIGKYAKI
ncbi:MAG: hypothetical protein M3Q34_02800 [bacterium]|nr:hypothetical protein [bacterium]